MSEIERLRKKVRKLSALLDFYNDLGRRNISSGKELNDVKAKMDFARDQMLKLCIESKKIIKQREKEGAVSHHKGA